jgi:Cu/Ag efflux pump CusA
MSTGTIIAVAFLPLFTLHGVEGVIFSPMAHTYAFAIGGALLLAVGTALASLSPALAPAQQAGPVALTFTRFGCWSL